LLAACAGDDSSSDSATTTASQGSAFPSTAARDTATPPTTGGADTGAPATTIAPATKTVRFVVANTNIPVTFTVPDDDVTTNSTVWLSPTYWTVDDGWGAHNGADIGMVGVQFAVISNIYADGCHHSPLAPPVGPTVDDLAEAWANLPQYSATAAIDLTVDGYAGKQVGFTVPDYNVAECGGRGDDPSFFVWQVSDRAGFFAIAPNQQIDQRILDVNGTRLVISAYYSPSSPPQDRAALNEALASIQIG
jgi:hypothetical protein